MKADLVSTNHGSIITIAPQTDRGWQWMRKHVNGGAFLAQDGYISCDRRYGLDILEGAIADGLRLRDTTTGRTAGGN